MTTIQIILKDTDDGLVDVETTVTGWDKASNAQALSNRVNAFLAEIAREIHKPKLEPELVKP